MRCTTGAAEPCSPLYCHCDDHILHIVTEEKCLQEVKTIACCYMQDVDAKTQILVACFAAGSCLQAASNLKGFAANAKVTGYHTLHVADAMQTNSEGKFDTCRWHSESLWQPLLHPDIHECDESQLAPLVDGGPTTLHQVTPLLLAACVQTSVTTCGTL